MVGVSPRVRLLTGLMVCLLTSVERWLLAAYVSHPSEAR